MYVCPPAHMPACPPACIFSLCVSVCLYLCLSACLAVRLPVCLAACPSVCSLACPSVRLTSRRRSRRVAPARCAPVGRHARGLPPGTLASCRRRRRCHRSLSRPLPPAPASSAALATRLGSDLGGAVATMAALPITSLEGRAGSRLVFSRIRSRRAARAVPL